MTAEKVDPVSPAPAAPGTAGVVHRFRAATAHALPALLGYAAVRAVGILTVLIWRDSTGRNGLQALARADGGWFLGIAQHGYDNGEVVRSNLAFFPLYPGLVAGLEPLTPLGYRNTGLVFAWLAGLAAAWGLFAIGDHLYGRRVGVLLAIIWGVLPHGIVESMTYTEGLFTALAAWSLYALLRGRWLTAAILCLFAGLTRTTGSSLLAVVCLAALIAVIRRRDGWRPWVALLVAPLGWLGYLAWVGVRTGRPDGWFHIQSAQWGSSFDFGVDTYRRGQETLAHSQALEMYVVTLVAAAAILLFVLSVLDRQPWQLLLYSGLMLITTLGAGGYYHSKARFLLPAFALLLPVAVGLAKASRGRLLAILTTLTIMSAWFGGYLLVLWPRSP